MDTNPKYIVYYEGKIETFVIFPCLIKHVDMAPHAGIGTIISAGFVNNWFECYGESIGLGKKSRIEKDTALIRAHFSYEK